MVRLRYIKEAFQILWNYEMPLIPGEVNKAFTFNRHRSSRECLFSIRDGDINNVALYITYTIAIICDEFSCFFFQMLLHIYMSWKIGKNRKEDIFSRERNALNVKAP